MPRASNKRTLDPAPDMKPSRGPSGPPQFAGNLRIKSRFADGRPRALGAQSAKARGIRSRHSARRALRTPRSAQPIPAFSGWRSAPPRGSRPATRACASSRECCENQNLPSTPFRPRPEGRRCHGRRCSPAPPSRPAAVEQPHLHTSVFHPIQELARFRRLGTGSMRPPQRMSRRNRLLELIRVRHCGFGLFSPPSARRWASWKMLELSQSMKTSSVSLAYPRSQLRRSSSRRRSCSDF